MKVKELKEFLANLSDDYEVVIGDGKGNYFSPLAEIVVGLYEPSSTWDGDFNTTRYLDIDESDYSQMVDDSDGVEDIPEEEFNAICLWPTN